MNYILVYFLILRFSRNFADNTILPVMMMDADNVMNELTVESNPFSKMSSAQFADILIETIKVCEAVIIFVEENLSAEDLSIKDKLGTPYKHMHDALKAKRVKYFPGVRDPYKLFLRIFEPLPYNVFYLRPGMKPQIVDKNFKHIFIYFQDGVNSTRANTLRKHDTVINEVNLAVRQLKPGPVVAFYTGKVNPVQVEKLEFVPIKQSEEPRDVSVMVVSEGAMFRFIGVYAATATRRANFDQVPLIGEETWTPQRLSTKMAYTDFELQFHFGFAEKEWQIDSVALLEGGEEVGRTRMGVQVPWGFSYLCGEPLVIVNRRDNSFVSISQYQIQPRNPTRRQDPASDTEPDPDPPAAPDPDPPGAPDPDPPSPVPDPLSATPAPFASTECFATAINCGPYFNTNILATLFITFLCLGIAMSGIMMMMSCKGNDSYEDPQGKPLVIASETTPT